MKWFHFINFKINSYYSIVIKLHHWPVFFAFYDLIFQSYERQGFTSFKVFIYLVRHECGEGASNLMVVNVGLSGTKQDEKKANRNRDLEYWFQSGRLTQPDKGHGWLFQKLEATWQEK